MNLVEPLIAVRNMSGRTVKVSELRFTLVDRKSEKTYTSYQMTTVKGDFIITPNEEVEFQVSFDVGNLPNDDYILIIKSSIDTDLSSLKFKIEKSK